MVSMDSITRVAFELLISLNIGYSADQHRKPVNHDELFCLAQNVYFEARAESMQGKIAVASVVKNRIKDPKFPKTYCGVIRDGKHYESWKTKGVKDMEYQHRVFIPRKNQCQFSWYCDGMKDVIWIQLKDGTPVEHNKTSWRDAVNVALMVMGGQVRDNTGGATYYYAHNQVYPGWAGAFTSTEVIGNHTFLKR